MVRKEDDEMLEIAYGGFVFRAPYTLFGPTRFIAEASLELAEAFDEEFLEELLELALEGDESFEVLYRPGDALRRSEPSLTF